MCLNAHFDVPSANMCMQATFGRLRRQRLAFEAFQPSETSKLTIKKRRAHLRWTELRIGHSKEYAQIWTVVICAALEHVSYILSRSIV
eukprot:4238734-Pleurochrysis_carterae.AAC.5